MRTIICILAAFAVLSSLTSCKSRIKGDEPEVTKLVIELCQEQLKEIITPILVKERYPTTYFFNMPTYKLLKEKSDDKECSKLVREIDSLIDGRKLSINYIRITEQDKELNKVACSAVLLCDGEESYDIEYTAQITTDNENVYVELKNITPKR